MSRPRGKNGGESPTCFGPLRLQLIRELPSETVVIDTSNYYPMRDNKIDAIEAGQVESLWVAEQLGRPVVKA